MNQLVVTDIKARLPMPQGMDNLKAGEWRVLCESIFPSARTPESIVMALDYCRARKLDIMKKPVHIVPMWSSSLRKEVETVWPSINEVQTTAARTGQYAGMDEPKFGKDIARKFKGIKKDNVGETEVDLVFPESCSITVYRLIDGQRCAFTEPVFWTEAYGRIGKTELPNDQWAKRPRGMIIKVGKAASLRAAFPEEGEHTAEEMEGRTLEEFDAAGVVIDNGAKLKVSSPFKTAAMRSQFVEGLISTIDAAKTVAALNDVVKDSKAMLDKMRESTNEYDAMEVERLNQRYKMALENLKAESKPEDGKANIPGIGKVHREGSAADISALQGYPQEVEGETYDRLPDDEVPEFMRRAQV